MKRRKKAEDILPILRVVYDRKMKRIDVRGDPGTLTYIESRGYEMDLSMPDWIQKMNSLLKTNT